MKKFARIGTFILLTLILTTGIVFAEEAGSTLSDTACSELQNQVSDSAAQTNSAATPSAGDAMEPSETVQGANDESGSALLPDDATPSSSSAAGSDTSATSGQENNTLDNSGVSSGSELPAADDTSGADADMNSENDSPLPPPNSDSVLPPKESVSSSASSADSGQSEPSEGSTENILIQETTNALSGVEAQAAEGWYTAADGSVYYQNADGSYRKGMAAIDGQWYYLDDATGELWKGGWKQLSNGQWIYGRATDGVDPWGLNEIEGTWRYIDPNTGYLKTDLFQMHTGEYSYAPSGVINTGAQAYENSFVYVKPETKTLARSEFEEIGGATYYLSESFTPVSGLTPIQGQWYYLDDTTAQLWKGGWKQLSNGQWIYGRATDGVDPWGLNEIEGTWRYIHPGTGYLMTGLFQMHTGDYSYAPSGVINTGAQAYENSFVYVKPETKTLARSEFEEIGSATYYLTDKFTPARGLTAIKGQWYYLDDTTAQLWKGGWKQLSNGQWIYGRPKDGVDPWGLNLIDGTWRYIHPGTGYLMTGLFQMHTGDYSYAPSGVINTGVQPYGSSFIYVKPETKTLARSEFEEIGGATYYLTDKFTPARGLTAIKGQWYYLDDTTAQLWKGGWKQLSNGQWIYGRPKDGVDPWGLNLIDGTWRYIHPSTGYLMTGLFQMHTGDYSYAPNGVIVNGFHVLDNADTLYIDPSTHACYIGWLDYNNNTFYFGENGLGVKRENFLPTAAGTEYYWFYFEPYWGNLLKNTYVTLNGKQYWVDSWGIIMNYTGDGTFFGIDVSKAQGAINWATVKNGGAQFAIIRVLGATNAGYYIDPYFETNVSGAFNAGLQVGAYLYSYAFNESEMIYEVNFVLPTLNKYKTQLTYPVFVDYEDNLLLNNTTSNAQRTNILRTGMNTLQQNGYLSGFYTYYNFAKNYLNTQQLLNEGYDFWVAHTSASENPWPGASIWQYSHKGTIGGITGVVDLNTSYVDYSQLSRIITVYDVNTGKNVSGRLRDIVAQIVQNEVGGGVGLSGSDAKQLYLAQAVAAHSWLEYQWGRYGANYVPSVGLKTPTAAVTEAANQVARFAVTYNGSVANTAYGSASSAMTNTAANMGWGSFAYLTSVPSAYESWSEAAAAWQGKTTTLSQASVKLNIEKILGTGKTNSYDPSQWITNITYDSNGYCTGVTLCGTRVSGGVFYEKFYGLYSPCFTMTYSPSGKSWTFKTYGNGHGVGMSQYGAAGYIAKGNDWRWVLAHYYPGTTIQ